MSEVKRWLARPEQEAKGAAASSTPITSMFWACHPAAHHLMFWECDQAAIHLVIHPSWAAREYRAKATAAQSRRPWHAISAALTARERPRGQDQDATVLFAGLPALILSRMLSRSLLRVRTCPEQFS